MAPTVPEEVNVFSIPHSRMKELVNAYVDMIKKTNFTNDLELELLLESLLRTFMEFKTHEQIENQFIMKKLKNKLRQLSIKNSAVCNCHSDDSLSEMMHFIEKGYRKKTELDRVNFGVQLKQALEEFTESFLPHMKEEEEVFQPLLLQYFSYEELRDLRQKVIQQHIMTEQGQLLREQAAKSGGKIRNSVKNPQKEKADISKADEVDDGVVKEENCYISNLPPEIMMKIFSHLTPPELGRCRQVNHEWSRLALAPELWRDIIPVQWAQGQWDSLVGDVLGDDDEEEFVETTDDDLIDDEYAAIDDVTLDNETDDLDDMTDNQQLIQREAEILTGLVKNVLPRAGKGVKILALKNSKAITNGLLNKMLQLCPNVEILDLTQTKISDQGLQWLGKFGVGSQLKKLVLSGCANISDATLVRLAMAQHQSLKKTNGRPEHCPLSTPKVENSVTLHNKPKLKHTTSSVSLEPTYLHEMTDQQDPDCEYYLDEEEDLCCQETGEGVCCSEIIHMEESSTSPRDCLCEAYFNECRQPIQGGCEMKITTTCKKSSKQPTKKLAPQVMFERPIGCCRNTPNSSCTRPDTQGSKSNDVTFSSRGERNESSSDYATYSAAILDDMLNTHGNQAIMTKKDPDSDLDFAMLSMEDDLLYDTSGANSRYTYGDGAQNPKPNAPFSVDMREKPEHLNVQDAVSGDVTVPETNDSIYSGKTCHANCSYEYGLGAANDVELDAIEDCIPRARTWPENELTLNSIAEKPDFRLEHLNLSGCFQVTDVGLRALGRIGQFPRLEFLDLSGCFRLTSDGIEALVSVCPALGSGLYYCDNIEDGPLSEEAGGCRNLGCGSRVCCRSGQ